VRHHTKDKGDIGLACVIADLVRRNIQVALPISEHLPFDLIAIHPHGAMIRVSVKYRMMSKTGTVTVETRSMWADRNGTHHRRHHAGDYDAVAIYCPDTDKCYYLLASELWASGRTLRITSPANNQMTGVSWPRLFTPPNRLFEPGSQRQVVGTGHFSSMAACPGQESNPQSAV